MNKQMKTSVSCRGFLVNDVILIFVLLKIDIYNDLTTYFFNITMFRVRGQIQAIKFKFIAYATLRTMHFVNLTLEFS